ncbi:MAG: hypothetical protein SVG88_05770 [Halobacteriales archaeon]|nr:hypothetical protein [Halobacteriales archaeon]
MAGPIQTLVTLAVVLIAYAMVIVAVLSYAVAAVIGIGGVLFTLVSLLTAVLRIGRIALGHDEPWSELRAAISFPLSIVGGTSLGVGVCAGVGRVLTVVAVVVIDRLTDRNMAILQQYLIDVYDTSAFQLPVGGVTIRMPFWQAALVLIIIGGTLVIASSRIAPEDEDPTIEEKAAGWQPSWMREGFGEDDDTSDSEAESVSEPNAER